MNLDLIAARDAAVAQQDVIVAAHAPRYDVKFAEALAPVVAELDRVATVAAAGNSDAIELSRTWRWLGDAHFEHARFAGRPSWYAGAKAYLEAERALPDDSAPVERAKLDFNFANTLAQLSEGTDIALLESAEIRARRAADVFKRVHLTSLAAKVEQRLALLRTQLKMARVKTLGDGELARLQGLVERAARADPVEQLRVRRELGEMAKRFDPRAIADAIDECSTTLTTLDSAARLGPEILAQLLASMNELAAAMKPYAEGKVASSTDTTEFDNLAGELLQRIASDGDTGRISSDRARQLRRLLENFVAAVPEPSDDVLTHEATLGRMNEARREAADAWLTRRRPDPPPPAGSRAARVNAMIDGLARVVLAEQLKPMLPAAESHRSNELFAAISELSTIADQGQDNDARLRELEPRLWRMALDVQQFVRRHHLVVAEPVFSMTVEHAPVMSLFVSGGATLARAASRLAARDGVIVFAQARRNEVGQERWSQLLAASVAVFDIGLPNGPARMQVGYELGLALALGKPCVIAKRADTIVPFDVEIPPILFTEDAGADFELLDAAVSAELSGVRWGGRTAGLGDGANAAIEAITPHVLRARSQALDLHLRMALANSGDAMALHGSLNNIVGGLGVGSPAIVLPAWSPSKRDLREPPRCFHVMPFGQAWSNATRDRLAEACKKRGWTYSRGDESDEQRIVPGIWRDLCRASAVVIDITGSDENGPNLNVGLELGLVHALGRPCRIVTRGRPERHLFPAVAKVRVLGYRAEDEARRRGRWLDRFVPSTTPLPNLPSLDEVVAPLLQGVLR